MAILRTGRGIVGNVKGGRGFTLIEVLVVLGVISLLLSILGPGLGKARSHARHLVGRSNQRQIVRAVTLYAFDQSDHFPDSVATIGVGNNWNWSEPTMITGYQGRSPRIHRAMSSYIGDYVNDVDIMLCPNAPQKHRNLQDAWQAGDDWDNPDTGPVNDPFSGNYCFYWNYTGNLREGNRPLQGPRTSAGRRGESKLVVSDYLGFDHWRSRDAYGSCEKFKLADITPGTLISSSYWSRSSGSESLDTITVRLQAAFTDEHVEDYSAASVVPMRVILNVITGEPYPQGIGPGIYYLPGSALH